MSMEQYAGEYSGLVRLDDMSPLDLFYFRELFLYEIGEMRCKRISYPELITYPPPEPPFVTFLETVSESWIGPSVNPFYLPYNRAEFHFEEEKMDDVSDKFIMVIGGTWPKDVVTNGMKAYYFRTTKMALAWVKQIRRCSLCYVVLMRGVYDIRRTVHEYRFELDSDECYRRAEHYDTEFTALAAIVATVKERNTNGLVVIVQCPLERDDRKQPVSMDNVRAVCAGYHNCAHVHFLMYGERGELVEHPEIADQRLCHALSTMFRAPTRVLSEMAGSLRHVIRTFGTPEAVRENMRKRGIEAKRFLTTEILALKCGMEVRVDEPSSNGEAVQDTRAEPCSDKKFGSEEINTELEQLEQIFDEIDSYEYDHSSVDGIKVKQECDDRLTVDVRVKVEPEDPETNLENLGNVVQVDREYSPTGPMYESGEIIGSDTPVPPIPNMVYGLTEEDAALILSLAIGPMKPTKDNNIKYECYESTLEEGQLRDDSVDCSQPNTRKHSRTGSIDTLDTTSSAAEQPKSKEKHNNQKHNKRYRRSRQRSTHHGTSRAAVRNEYANNNSTPDLHEKRYNNVPMRVESTSHYGRPGPEIGPYAGRHPPSYQPQWTSSPQLLRQQQRRVDDFGIYHNPTYSNGPSYSWRSPMNAINGSLYGAPGHQLLMPPPPPPPPERTPNENSVATSFFNTPPTHRLKPQPGLQSSRWQMMRRTQEAAFPSQNHRPLANPRMYR